MRLWDPHQSWPPQRLLAMLKDCQAREKESWKKSLLDDSLNKTADIGPAERDHAAAWISQLISRFSFYPETFFLAVHILDRFLTAVKSPPKYLKCIAVSCIYLASKIMEEEEVIPGTRELVLYSNCGCRVKDILRMERIILSKLGWDIYTPTPLNYLQIFHALAFSSQTKTKTPPADEEKSKLRKSSFLSRHLQQLTTELHYAICRYKLVSFPSSAFALALLSIEVENITSSPSKWLMVTSKLQGYAKIKTSDLLGCRETLLSLLPRRLCNPHLNNPVYVVANLSQGSEVHFPKQKKPRVNHAIANQVGAVKRKANDTNSVAFVSDHIKKIHTVYSRKCDSDLTPFLADSPHVITEERKISADTPPDLAICDASLTQGVAVDFGGTEELSAQTPLKDNNKGPNTVKNILSADACEDHASPPSLRPQSVNSCPHTQLSDEDHMSKPEDSGPMIGESFVGDLLVDGGIYEEDDLLQSQAVKEDDFKEYDSDQTLTASEGEEEDDCAERKKHEETRLRPLTYAEIVRCGILESTATIVTVANVTRACF